MTEKFPKLFQRASTRFASTFDNFLQNAREVLNDIQNLMLRFMDVPLHSTFQEPSPSNPMSTPVFNRDLFGAASNAISHLGNICDLFV